jgi:hypothetical protein
MESWEAIERAIQRFTTQHARKLGLSNSMVNKWQEPTTDFTDSGAYNPLDRIVTIMETALTLRLARQDALTPLRWLANQFDCVVIPTPSVNRNFSDIQSQLCKTIKEFGELAAAASSAFTDGKLNKTERKNILSEGWQMIEAATTFLKMIELSEGRHETR